jgi:twitching motility protein PilT
LSAIVRADGDALVMHVGERPYVVVGTQTINISTHGLNLDAMTGMLAQLLPADAQTQLEEFGAVEHRLTPPGEDRFTVVAARGGDDIWIEIRRRRAQPAAAAPPAPIETPKAPEVVAAAPEPAALPEPIPEPMISVEAVADQPGAESIEPESVEPEPVVINAQLEPVVINAQLEPVVINAQLEPIVGTMQILEVVEPASELEVIEWPTAEEVAAQTEEPLVQAAMAGIVSEPPAPSIDELYAEIPEPVAEIPEPVVAPILEAAEAVAEPLTAGVPEPVAEAVPELLVEAVPEPVVEAVAEPVVEPVAEPVVEPVPEPVSAIAVPIVETIPEPIPEPVAEIPEPVVEEIPEPVLLEAIPIPEPVLIEEIPEPVVAEEIAEPVAEATPEPVSQPVAPAIVEPHAAPAVEPVVAPLVEPAPIAASIEPEPAPLPSPAVVLPMTRTVRIEVPPRVAAAASRSSSDIERLLRVAAARGASALFLTSESRPWIRMEGDLRQLESEPAFSRADVERAVMEIAPESGHDSIGKGEATEWIAEFADVGRIRCTTFADHHGPGMLLRMIATRAATAEQLGLVREVQALATEPQGVVLVAGPRGSGKSTLLSALVDLVNRQRAEFVITLERQIRLVHDNRSALVSQREIRGGAEDSVAAARSALREGPDVLVVDDLVSSQMVPLLLTAASEGLLIFVSLTAPSTADAVQRFVEMAPPEMRKAVQNAMAESFRGAVAQVLLKKAGGGLVAAREVLLATAPVTRVIAEGQLTQLPLALESGRKHGMVSFTEALADNVRSGVVDVREAFRKAPDRNRLLERLKRDGVDTSVVERLA